MPEHLTRRDSGSLFGPPVFSHNTRPAFNNTRLLEPVSDYLAAPTPLFPLPAHSASSGHASTGQASREGEVCSFLRHSVRLLAEGVAGPARICNAGAGCRDTKVAPRGRGGQGGRSRVTQPCLHCHRAPTRDAPTDALGLPRLGVGFPGRMVGSSRERG